MDCHGPTSDAHLSFHGEGRQMWNAGSCHNPTDNSDMTIYGASIRALDAGIL